MKHKILKRSVLLFVVVLAISITAGPFWNANKKTPDDALVSFETGETDNNLFSTKFYGASCKYNEDDTGYFSVGNSIYFEGASSVIEIPTSSIFGGFACFAKERDRYYAKSNKHVYLNGEIIDGANPKSFTLIYDGPHYTPSAYHGLYSKDEKNVFLLGEKISEADPNTFQVIQYGRQLARDEGKVFLKDDVIFEGKVGNLKTLDGHPDYFTTDERVFVFNKIEGTLGVVPNADPKTFSHLFDAEGSVYTEDEENVYVDGIKAVSKNSNQFQSISTPYKEYVMIDNVLIWSNGSTKVSDIDSLEYIAKGFFSDKNNVYYTDSSLRVSPFTDTFFPTDSFVMMNVHPELFSILGEPSEPPAGYYFVHDEEVFVTYRAGYSIEIKKIEEANPETFELMVWPYAKDSDHIYIAGNILEGVSSKDARLQAVAGSEKVQGGQIYLLFTPDRVYDRSIELQGIHPQTLSTERNGLIIRDGDTVYYLYGSCMGSRYYTPASELPMPVDQYTGTWC